MEKTGFLILSGGKSTRMGSSKALLRVGEKTLLEHTAEAGSGFDMRILSVNDEAIPTPEGFIRCGDLYPGCGPMAGIHAAFVRCGCDALVTAPCDAPYYSGALADYLLACRESGYDAVLMTDAAGRVQPLFGVYEKSCAPILEAHLKTGRLKMMRMLDCLRVKQLPLPSWADSRSFVNLNTPQELEALLREKNETCAEQKKDE